ncbi:hypothetical protein [Clostridium magnum]|uniref:Uncharacterized protein n=1 Tax=Clostridium magnum DSM 2767 TaxID=1121326 RepID=A0A162SUJ3_9CLOT|nr:hypothetical protein [Clostridium magnum]KZL91887.1 hypothetical protein CLMAG_16930 [Clostridium magnum DSM 2767]SHI25351.1 hypothetical protein SAMN02745944_03626 [Clostridium magnum DSM 2767]
MISKLNTSINFDENIVKLVEEVASQHGLFERFPMDEIYGMHNRPGMPAG